jgi:hypothetical protein
MIKLAEDAKSRYKINTAIIQAHDEKTIFLSSQSRVTTDGQSVSPSRYRAPSGARPNIYYRLIFSVLSMSGAPSDERSGLSFVIVIVRPLSVNIYRFTCNVHVSDIYIYTIYTRPMSVQAENSRSALF